jgi:hypothetical protein
MQVDSVQVIVHSLLQPEIFFFKKREVYKLLSWFRLENMLLSDIKEK